MGKLYLDLIWRWKWALAAGALISGFLSYRIVNDPEFTFLSSAGSASGVNELILASLWGSLLISIDTARGTPRVWATLPIRSSGVSFVVWAISVLTFPVLSVSVFLLMALAALLDGIHPTSITLTPLALVDTVAYAGLAHLFFCEFQNTGLNRWRREIARAIYLLLLGGFFVGIRFFPYRWEGLTPNHILVLLIGLVACAAGFLRTRDMLLANHGAGQLSKPRVLRSRFSAARLLSGIQGGPIAESTVLGLVGGAVLLTPLGVVAWISRRQPDLFYEILNFGGWSQADFGFTLLVLLTFGVVFIGFYAAHPWMNAIRALRSMPYGPHRVAMKCLVPSMISATVVMMLVGGPLWGLLDEGLTGVLWFMVLISPGIVVVACAGYLLWGYSVVMIGVFGLVPASVAIHNVDSLILMAPPIAQLASTGIALIGAGYFLTYFAITRSQAAYQDKHVPWF